MHLAIVTPYPPAVTGIGQYGYHISGALARSGCFDRITLLASASRGLIADGASAGGASAERYAGLEIENIWTPGRLDSGWRILTRLRQLRPDIVWFNLGASVFGRSPLANLAGLFSPWMCRLIGLPTVVTLHEMVEQADLRALKAPGGPLAWLGARLLTSITTRADVVCVTLRRHADWLAKRRPNLRVMHIPIGSYDTPRRMADSSRHELLIFTTMAPFKGLDLLLDAFCSLQPHYPELRLTVAGVENPRTPGYLGEMQQAFWENPAIRWLGSVPETGLPGIFERATLVILPYRATTGSSSVLYRAATWGRAVVASDLPELRAAADEAGFKLEMFPSGDAPALAAAIERMLLDPARRLAQVEHNFEMVSHTTLDSTVHAYQHAFDLAFDNRSRRPRQVSSTRRQEAA